MEAMEGYRERKRRELELLDGRLRERFRIDAAAPVARLIELKLEMAAAYLAERLRAYPDLRETNFEPYETRQAGEYELRWKYQIADLAVENQPLLYPAIFDAAGADGLAT